jgi:hypothetical protein
MAGLKFELSSGRIVAASHFTPGPGGCEAIAINKCLDELKTSESHFARGHWRHTAEELQALILSRTGIEVSRRRIARYQQVRGEKSTHGLEKGHKPEKKLRSCPSCGQQFAPMSDIQWNAIHKDHLKFSKKHRD